MGTVHSSTMYAYWRRPSTIRVGAASMSQDMSVLLFSEYRLMWYASLNDRYTASGSRPVSVPDCGSSTRTMMRAYTLTGVAACWKSMPRLTSILSLSLFVVSPLVTICILSTGRSMCSSVVRYWAMLSSMPSGGV